MNHDLSTIVPCFQIPGDFVQARPYGSGHIHDTYEVVCHQAGTRVRYIAQRINQAIFPDVPALMENIARTTQHIRGKLEATDTDCISRRVLTLVPTADGADYYQGDDGPFWRVYLSGDVYFKVPREGQNLDRCRTQFKLVSILEEQEEALRRRVGAV